MVQALIPRQPPVVGAGRRLHGTLAGAALVASMDWAPAMAISLARGNPAAQATEAARGLALTDGQAGRADIVGGLALALSRLEPEGRPSW